jgi:hypothetical protein
MEDRSTQCQPTTTPIQIGPHADWSQLDLLEPLVQSNCDVPMYRYFVQVRAESELIADTLSFAGELIN